MRPIPMLRCVTLLLALLLLSACGRAAAATASATATPLPPTPTPFPISTMPPTPTVAVIQSGGQPIWGNTAHWSHANLPAGFGLLFHSSDLQVAASDGKTAYACAALGTQPNPRVIVTHDGGASWVYATTIPVAWGACARLVVDTLNPAVVIAQGDFLGPQEITLDGGKSWQALSLPPQREIVQLATRGQSAYAFMQVLVNGGSSATTILTESTDNMHTWHEIDGNLASANLRGFWLNPGSGALLLQTYDQGLWTSTDDGAHWQQLGIPETSIVDRMVQQPRANQPWHLCAEYYASMDNSTGSLVCTADGGHSWFAPPPVSFWQLAGIASDGSLLVYNRAYTVYRLPQGATRWQILGAAPQAGCCIQYIPSRNGDILWKFPAESDGAGISDKPNDVYVAAYPYR